MFICALMLISFTGALKASSDSLTTADQTARDFLQELGKEKFETAYSYFDDAVKAQFSIEQLKGLWEMLKTQHGAFESISEITGKDYAGSRLVFVTVSFKNSFVTFRIFLNTEGKAAGFFIENTSPKKEYQYPAYSDTSLFFEKEAVFGEKGCKLPAKMTIPKGKEEYPVVILVHGSGPHDMDETIGPNKPFADIAAGLASKGIAVFRYEKRTNACPEKSGKEITIDIETVNDAVSAVKFVSERDEINVSKIFLLGHSLGGYAAPRIAAKANLLDGIMLMGANLTPLEDLIVIQSEYLAKLDNNYTDEEKQRIELLKKQAETVKTASLSLSTVIDSLPLGIPPSYWQSLKNYKPAETAGKLNIPILILQAENDYQISLSEFEKWKKELKRKENVEFILLPGLNHLFMESSAESGPNEYFKEGHVSPELINAAEKWILEHSE